MSEAPAPSATEPGVVARQDARGVVVRLDDGAVLWCTVRGRLHLEGAVASTTTLAVGDRVRVRRVAEGRVAEGRGADGRGADGAGADGRGTVEEVAPRRSVLARPEPDQGRRRTHLRQRVLAANVDRVVVVASAAEPPLDRGIVDRVLVTAEWSRLAAMIVVNKLDLVRAVAPQGPPEVEAYRRLGYPVHLVSAVTGDGVDALRRDLVGSVSVVTGHSGVGKTSLLNAIEPGLSLAVGRLNEVTGRGRQTTTSGVYVPLRGGGAVIDTPGVREFGLYNVPRRDLPWLFPDLRAVARACRFNDCLHVDEPGCAVRVAVAAGEIVAWRFASYLRMLETLPDVPPWGMPSSR